MKNILIVKLCGGGAYHIRTKKSLKLNLERIAEKLNNTNFNIKITTPHILLLTFNSKELTIYKNGKILVKNADNEEEAIKMANELYEVFYQTPL